ncbi:MAG: glutamine-hydrolyzing carbamoyl-phosphate synthase small subunit [archaeon]
MKHKLVLEDNSCFQGYSFGAETPVSGEVVFNTGMVGYPEALTDPSYKGQILVLTFPLIGNYGVPGDERADGIPKNFESDKIHISGLIITSYSDEYSHWNAKRSLGEWLKEQGIPALCGIDTRALTKRLREKGTMLGKIVFGDDVELVDPNTRNLVAEVSVDKPVEYGSGPRVVVVDCGVKYNIIRELIKRKLSVLRVPWDYDFTNECFDALVISNGPGDPKMCSKTIANVKKSLDREKPTLGICLGNQILALAIGAETYKLKYGHRSQNQPCIIAGTRKCFITSQNHGFAVDAKTLPEGWEEWWYNNNDKTNEGIRHKTKPFFSSQFHPEAYPGPDDTEFIFDEFAERIWKSQKK